jgi:hypothetical protein
MIKKLIITILCFPVLLVSGMAGSVSTCLRYHFEAATAMPEADSIDALVNGWLYHYETVRNGQPYFGDQNWNKSTIQTRYETFNDVLVKYDIYQDVLLMPLYRTEGTFPLVLNPQTIKNFKFRSHLFVNLNNILPHCETEYPGYYEMIYDGNLKLVIKWQKVMTDKEKVSGGSFETNRTLYLIRDNQLYLLRRNASVIKLFPQFKQEIRKYLRERQIFLNRSGDNELKDLFSHLDQLVQ